MSNLHDKKVDRSSGKQVVIDPSNLQNVTGHRNEVDARVNSGDQNVIRGHSRIHGNPIFGNNTGNEGNTTLNTSVVDNNKNTNTMNSNNKGPLYVKGDDNMVDRRLNSGDANVVGDHVEIDGSPIFGHNSGNKKGSGTTGR